MVRPATLFEKVWRQHLVRDLGDGFGLLHVDRTLAHDLSVNTFVMLRDRGLSLRCPELTFATPDHGISTATGRTDMTPVGRKLLEDFRLETARAGVRLFDVGSGDQGIVHAIGPELGLSLPGALIVCCDSHTCTHGGVGALGFGIGWSEAMHVFATQTIVQRRPRTMRVNLSGRMSPVVTAKDVFLSLAGRVGAAGADGFALEYAGEGVRSMSIEERLTLCNLAVELGAKIGMVAPDDTTFQYLHGRRYAPKDALWDRALANWRELTSDEAAPFDHEVALDVGDVAPQITWGTSPEQVIAVDGHVPDPAAIDDQAKRRAAVAALEYMDLQPGRPIEGVKVDWVFIGSCTNGRLSDLRAAAGVARGRKVAEHVTAWVVPASERISREAEAEGLDRVFREAGFDWRDPGCSMCLASNGETVPPGRRSVSTTNRNFVGRQGPGARTHLASPSMAAAAAVAGAIIDVRKLPS